MLIKPTIITSMYFIYIHKEYSILSSISLFEITLDKQLLF